MPVDKRTEPKFCYVMFPVDFFRRAPVLRMIQRWPRAVEWWYSMVSIAREAQAGGKIGSRADLEVLHRTEIAEDFLQHVIELEWLKEIDGVLHLAKPSDWYRPPSKLPEAEARRSADRRRNSTADQPQTDRNSTANRPPVTAHKSSQDQVNPIQVNPSQDQDNPSQSNPSQSTPEPLEGPDGQISADLDRSERTTSSASAPTASIGRTAREVFAALQPRKRWGEAESRQLTEFIDENHPDYPPEHLAEALRYAAQATAWQQAHGPELIKRPFAYTLSTASGALPLIADRAIDRAAAAREGWPDPGPLNWQPPRSGGSDS